MGNHEKAIKYYQKASSLAPWINEYHFELSRSYFEIGNCKKALQELEKAKILGLTETKYQQFYNLFNSCLNSKN